MKRLFLALLVSATTAFGQVKTDKEGPQAHMNILGDHLDLVVDVDKDLTPSVSSDISVKYLPSGKTIVPDVKPMLTTGSFQQFSAVISRIPKLLPEAADTSFEVTIRKLLFVGSESTTLVVKGTIYDDKNAESLLNATSQALAPTKTTDEKDLFTGFTIATPSKDGAVTTDIVFNRTIASLASQLKGSSFVDSGSFGFKLKKGSMDGKDPRHFSLGFDLRKTTLLANSADIKTLRDAVNFQSNIPSETALSALRNVRSRFFRAFLFDYGLQVESDISEKGLGKVSDLITDIRPQLATAAMPAFGEKGYFTLRLLPAGLEVGHNISKGEVTREFGSLARFKGGLEAKFYYENNEKTAAIQRVELNVAQIYRRLFQEELAYDAKTKKTITSNRHDMMWTQVDFKVLLGSGMNTVRPGFKATYQRGYLPPVFAFTKTFSYGLVFESIN